MTEKKVFEEVKAYLLENEDELRQTVNEVNSWNGALYHRHNWYDNDEEFFETYFTGRPAEAVRAVCFGEYSYGDDYVRYDEYENLVSADEYTIIREMKDDIEEIANAVIKHKDNIDLSAELVDIIEQEDEEDEDE
ncbi:hypothetical protein [Bacillus phage phiAGATE]|uniref:Uncharacterized protein n=1 Tax=Bacillus phage phiAGATE TaxID=1204533 RepID=L0L8D8_9CAUD|nr:hypothetical protein G380_gp014 [Bacillus phage phiAGATE]AGB62664.1 hypothetical protein [Bacillus phage phiAGATE]